MKNWERKSTFWRESWGSGRYFDLYVYFFVCA